MNYNVLVLCIVIIPLSSSKVCVLEHSSEGSAKFVWVFRTVRIMELFLVQPILMRGYKPVSMRLPENFNVVIPPMVVADEIVGCRGCKGVGVLPEEAMSLEVCAILLQDRQHLTSTKVLVDEDPRDSSQGERGFCIIQNKFVLADATRSSAIYSSVFLI
jgi:hypothetical protein